MNHFDCIVLGFGGVGSAALRFAALQGWRVLGIDRFGPAHDRGSSHGRTRVIRKAYFEHPDYVPLLLESYELWDELNKRYRTKPAIPQLYHQTGVLTIGRPESELIRGVTEAARQHDLRCQTFSAEEVKRRLPIFNLFGNEVGVFEQDGGYLLVEQCVAAMISQAMNHGALLQSNTVVDSWHVDSAGLVNVETDQGKFSAERLIVSAGPWASPLLPFLKGKLSVLRKQQHWYQLDRVDQKEVSQFPVFVCEQTGGDVFYGLPEIDYLGMKVCRHTGGQKVDDPTKIDRSLDDDERAAVESFMERRMVFGRKRLVHHCICPYTMSPDGHFIVDRALQHENVVFAAGLSGHGFKLTPVIGKYLVEMLEGKSRPEFEFLKLSRF